MNVKQELIKLLINDSGLITGFRDIYKDHASINLTDGQLLKELNALDNRLILEVLESAARDTCVRESILSQHAFNMTGRDWPINGDTEEVKKKFKRDLSESYITGGYELYEV